MEWQSLSLPDIEEKLKTDLKNGLSETAAKNHLTQFGENKLREEKRDGILKRFFSQFADFTVIILLCAAGISFFISHYRHDADYMDSIIILSIVFINALIGTIQESRAENALEALKKLSAPHARVIRDGKRKIIPASSLVPGDIVLIQAGDIIPADIRLTESADIRCDEASLTGESHLSEKDASLILPKDTSVGDRKNMLFAGCSAASGHGIGVVVSTGMETQMGHIAGMIHSGKPPLTPLQQKLDKTGKILGISALLICAVIFILGLFQKNDPLEMFMVSISLAVAAIPEGLPAVVTIVLAVGVKRMAGINAIVRKMPSVEALGSATVICSDKTGTLTQNKMTVTQVNSVSGPCKSIQKEKILSFASLCTNCVSQNGRLFGDATETAIVRASEITKRELENSYPRISEIPFSSSRKIMSTLHRSKSGYLMVTKGAPDYILKKCSMYEENGVIEKLNASVKSLIISVNSKMASEALRVLAVAYREISSVSEFREGNLIFLGFIGIWDPPRAGVRESVSVCQKAGIRVVMITGDHKNTASAVAGKLNIPNENGKIMTGAELDKISDDEFAGKVSSYDIFARVTPEHKVRIIKALQKNGETVAMTGDGVNDAPALKIADIGCAMGKSGTETAKEASDIILTDDNFSTIVSAVREGRGIYRNIRRTVHFLLSCNIGEILTVFASVLIRIPTPLAAVQLLWVNLITDSLPALALGAEPLDEDIMQSKPLKNEKGVFLKGDLYNIITEGLLIGALALLAFTTGRSFFDKYPADPVIGRTMCLSVLSLSQIAHSFNLKSHNKKGSKLWGASAICIVLQIFAIWFHPLSVLLGVVPLDFKQAFIVFLLSILPIIIVKFDEFVKNVSFFRKLLENIKRVS